jgi:Ni/Fe-hydrogenase 1 B-type cytochrome subunit
MATIETKSDSGSSYFFQKHSLPLRIWHWLTFFVISGSIITVLLTSTILNQRKNIPLVQNNLKEKGLTVSEDQAFSVTREYEDKIWDIHKMLGYGLAFLLLSRIIIELVQPGEEKIRNRIRTITGLYKNNPGDKEAYRHFIGVKTGYLIFYLILLCMILTGLSMAFGRQLGIPRQINHTLREIHSFGQYLIYLFVIIHLSGVVIAENMKHKGIVSGMINGNS